MTGYYQHGRRGGGWVPKTVARPSSKPKKVRPYDELPRCAVCNDMVPGLDPKKLPDPVTCSRICDHRAMWTEEEWAGRARMAAARREAPYQILVAGDVARRVPVELDELDVEALNRYPQPWTEAA
jgi:hypothetical protein